ncbi:MAG: hypothetical protein SGBAC_010745 [Bacillariaceae sp.]
MTRESFNKPDPEPSVQFSEVLPNDDSSASDDVEFEGRVRQEKLKDKGFAEEVTSDGVQPSRFSAAWTRALVKIRQPVARTVVWLADIAARHPKMTVAIGIVLAFELAIIGVLTNFELIVDGDVLWTPTPSTVLSHGDYLKDESEFSSQPRWARMSVHTDGANVLENPHDSLQRVFQALDLMVTTEGYDQVCSEATDWMFDENGSKTCRIDSIARFFNYSSSIYKDHIKVGSDLRSLISKRIYPDGTPVIDKLIMGKPQRSGADQLESAQILVTLISLPEADGITDGIKDFEDKLLTRLLDLRDEWANEPGNTYRLEVFTERSFDDELERAIVRDIPLVPLIFVVMSLFTGFVFFRKNWIHSHCLLGFGAVCSVFLSIMVGYGSMFIIGVPFTSMTQIVPFVMFGIGLDDAFIIWGAFQRMDRSIPILDRVHDTMEEVGVSIFVTTFTSVVAFGLGSLSVVPVVYWLCYYAAPTIFIDFIYQTTFFVALIVLDEQRVEAKKRDCFTCLSAPQSDDDEKEAVPQRSLADRFMSWYADVLLNPVVKVVVLAVFCGMFAGLGYRASLLEQKFSYTDVLPDGSYVADFWGRFEDYTGGSAVSPFVVFRDVDQSDPLIRNQMVEYVNGLVKLREVSEPPEFFWVRDFEIFGSSDQLIATLLASLPGASGNYSTFATSSATVAQAMTQMTFEQQLDLFMAVPVYQQLYHTSIARDGNGKILASRTRIRMTELDQHSVTEQVDALENQRLISEAQAINSNSEPEDWKFFTFIKMYYIWQFYTEAPNELVLTTILGVGAVSFISLLFIPHWSSIFFVAPIIAILYVDLLGFLQLCGVSINAVSYLSLVMSIGLLVDFLLHILLRFFESKETTRNAKVKDVMETMGASILVGGLSTFLGVLPLMFSKSDIFSIIFYSFLGLVVLGMSHGLIFLPVVLSLFGPNVVLEIS